MKRPDGHGGWSWGIGPDTRRVLYRLPRIVTAQPSDVIWIVEGESVDALGRLAEVLGLHELVKLLAPYRETP